VEQVTSRWRLWKLSHKANRQIQRDGVGPLNSPPSGREAVAAQGAVPAKRAAALGFGAHQTTFRRGLKVFPGRRPKIPAPEIQFLSLLICPVTYGPMVVRIICASNRSHGPFAQIRDKVFLQKVAKWCFAVLLKINGRALAVLAQTSNAAGQGPGLWCIAFPKSGGLSRNSSATCLSSHSCPWQNVCSAVKEPVPRSSLEPIFFSEFKNKKKKKFTEACPLNF